MDSACPGVLASPAEVTPSGQPFRSYTMPHTESTHEVATPRTDVTVCLTAIQEFVGKRWNDDVRLEILTVSLLPQVECDPTAFRDAVLQLLSNAREAMPDGGSIAVTVLIARLQPTK